MTEKDFYKTISDNEDSKEIKLSEYLRIFELHRDYLMHEDQLVNQRTTWFVALNSFLFTSMALSYKVLDGAKPEVLYAVNFSMLLAIVGIVSSAVTYLSVGAAYRAMRHLSSNWRHCYSSKYGETAAGANLSLPSIIGGGPRWSEGFRTGGDSNALRGALSPRVLQLVVGGAWVSVFMFGLRAQQLQCDALRRAPNESGNLFCDFSNYLPVVLVATLSMLALTIISWAFENANELKDRGLFSYLRERSKK